MSTRKILTFAQPQAAPDPVGTNDKLRFRDITLIPALREKALRWTPGPNWIRILPPIQGSSYQWMMRTEIIQAPDGQGERLPTFCHPKSFDRSARSPFDEAYDWFRKNSKGELYNRDKNPNGLKLNTKSQGVAWVIHTGAEPGEKLGLFCASLYDGSWGGSAGLAYKVWQEANQVDTEPNSETFEQKVYDDITFHEAGNLVLIEKHKPESGDRFASYTVRIGKSAAPVEKYLETLTDEEHNLITPLEEVFYRPDETEQHQILRDYIGTKAYRTIFGEGEATGTETSEEVTPEPTPKPKAKPAPEVEKPVEEEIEETVEDDEPAEPAKATKPAAKEPTKEATATGKTFSIREVSTMMGTKEGVEELLQNFKSIQSTHQKVLLEVATDMGIDVTKYKSQD